MHARLTVLPSELPLTCCKALIHNREDVAPLPSSHHGRRGCRGGEQLEDRGGAGLEDHGCNWAQQGVEEKGQEGAGPWKPQTSDGLGQGKEPGELALHAC